MSLSYERKGFVSTETKTEEFFVLISESKRLSFNFNWLVVINHENAYTVAQMYHVSYTYMLRESVHTNISL